MNITYTAFLLLYYSLLSMLHLRSSILIWFRIETQWPDFLVTILASTLAKCTECSFSSENCDS